MFFQPHIMTCLRQAQSFQMKKNQTKMSMLNYVMGTFLITPYLTWGGGFFLLVEQKGNLKKFFQPRKSFHHKNRNVSSVRSKHPEQRQKHPVGGCHLKNIKEITQAYSLHTIVYNKSFLNQVLQRNTYLGVSNKKFNLLRSKKSSNPL